MEKELKKLCLECGKPVLGRVDKKFCNDWCRNNYNNKLKADTGTVVKTINAILQKNRKILEAFVPQDVETAKASKQKLLDKGFNFNYYTNIYKTKKGTEYYFCYDYGYLVMEHDYYFIVKRKEPL
jgi:hypothetical protein